MFITNSLNPEQSFQIQQVVISTYNEGVQLLTALVKAQLQDTLDRQDTMVAAQIHAIQLWSSRQGPHLKNLTETEVLQTVRTASTENEALYKAIDSILD